MDEKNVNKKREIGVRSRALLLLHDDDRASAQTMLKREYIFFLLFYRCVRANSTHVQQPSAYAVVVVVVVCNYCAFQ